METKEIILELRNKAGLGSPRQLICQCCGMTCLGGTRNVGKII